MIRRLIYKLKVRFGLIEPVDPYDIVIDPNWFQEGSGWESYGWGSWNSFKPDSEVYGVILAQGPLEPTGPPVTWEDIEGLETWEREAYQKMFQGKNDLTRISLRNIRSGDRKLPDVINGKVVR